MTLETKAPDGARLEAIATALRARDAKRAAVLAEPELLRGVQHPLLFTARALWLAESGRREEALADFQRASRLSPTNPAAWNAEGICLMELNRFEDAVEAFDKAIALEPRSAVLFWRKGWALEQARGLAEARGAYEQALVLDPNNTQALVRVAFIALRQGAWAAARDYAERGLRTHPKHQGARHVLAAADVEEGRFEQAEQGLLDLLKDEALTDQTRIAALSALGDLRDRQGRIDEAFQAYSQSKKLSQRLPVAPTTASGASMSETVRMLTAHFAGKSLLASNKAPASQVRGETHVFLVGFLRSGTTLLEHMLASHPGVVTLEEKGPIADAVGRFTASPSALDALFSAPDEVLEDYRARYWRRVRSYGVDPTDKVFVDKGPIYTVYLPVIFRLFPDAKILFAVRDPRDVVLSCFRRYFELNSTTAEFLTLDGTAHFYAAVMRLAEIYRSALPLDIHELRHESIVADFEGEARKLCEVLGLAFDAAVANFADRAKMGAVSTASAPQIARGLSSEGVGQWRRYGEHLAPVLPVLQRWVEKFGYPPA